MTETGLVLQAQHLTVSCLMQTWCRGKKLWECQLPCLLDTAYFCCFGVALLYRYSVVPDADMVPREEAVGERAAVPGLPPLLLEVLQGPRLQDA